MANVTVEEDWSYYVYLCQMYKLKLLVYFIDFRNDYSVAVTVSADFRKKCFSGHAHFIAAHSINRLTTPGFKKQELMKLMNSFFILLEDLWIPVPNNIHSELTMK